MLIQRLEEEQVILVQEAKQHWLSIQSGQDKMTSLLDTINAGGTSVTLLFILNVLKYVIESHNACLSNCFRKPLESFRRGDSRASLYVAEKTRPAYSSPGHSKKELSNDRQHDNLQYCGR